MPRELLVEFGGTVERGVSDRERTGLVVRSGGLRAWVEDAESERPFRARGVLREEHHGGLPDGVPSTHGTVRRIQMVIQPYVRAAERTWIPKPGEGELRDLCQSPAGFGDEETLPELRKIETGLLVWLDVDD